MEEKKLKPWPIALGLILAFFARSQGIGAMVMAFFIGIAVSLLADYLLDKVGL